MCIMLIMRLLVIKWIKNIMYCGTIEYQNSLYRQFFLSEELQFCNKSVQDKLIQVTIQLLNLMSVS